MIFMFDIEKRQKFSDAFLLYDFIVILYNSLIFLFIFFFRQV